jgi:hypothetical protein
LQEILDDRKEKAGLDVQVMMARKPAALRHQKIDPPV